MKFSDYFRENGQPSASRLQAFYGLVGTTITTWAIIVGWRYALLDLSWVFVGIALAPGIIGILPLCLKYIKAGIDSGKVEQIIKAYKGESK